MFWTGAQTERNTAARTRGEENIIGICAEENRTRSFRPQLRLIRTRYFCSKAMSRQFSALRFINFFRFQDNQYINKGDNCVLFRVTGKRGKRKSECSYQESNLRPSDYKFGCSTTELQETCGS